ncbi:MAG: HNH endonuclease signature motif containing protein [Actinomycetota bacterium]
MPTTPQSDGRPSSRDTGSWSGRTRSFPGPVRRRILERDPICAACHQRPSTIADHIVPVAEGGGDDESNGQGLCDPCHDVKTRSEIDRGRARRQARGQLPAERHPGLIW